MAGDGRAWRARAAIALIAMVAGVWQASQAGARVFASLPTFVAQVEEDLTNGAVLAGESVSPSGFEPCPNGLCLHPRVNGKFTYRIPVPPSAHGIRIRMWGQLPVPGSNILRASADGGRSFSTVFRDMQQDGQAAFDLPLVFDPSVPALLTVEATNGDVNMAMPFDRLEIGFFTAPVLPMPPVLSVVFMCATFVVVAAAVTRSPFRTLVAGGILVLAVSLRYPQFILALNRALDPDAAGYASFAQQMDLFSRIGFYSGAFDKREPLWILVVHLWFLAVGASASHLKLLTLALSVAVVWGMMRLAGAVFGRHAGWLAGMLVALSAPLAFESSRGLRLELELLLLIGFLYATFAWRRAKTVDFRWVLVVGVLAGLLTLTRSAYLSSAVPLVLLGAYSRREDRPARQWIASAVAAALLAALMVAPHRYAFYQRYGDPFWDTASYARAIANTEFAGTPGFPTRAEIAVDGNMGPPLTYRQYLFGLHTPAEVVRSTLAGFAGLFRHMEFCRPDSTLGRLCTTSSVILQILSLAGFAVALFSRSLVWIPLAFALLEFPMAFLYDRNILELYRHTLHGFPLVILGALTALDAAIAPFRRRASAPADACAV